MRNRTRRPSPAALLPTLLSALLLVLLPFGAGTATAATNPGPETPAAPWRTSA